MWSPLGTHHTFINKYMCQDSKALIISHGLRFILARMLQTCKYYFLWHPSYSNDNTQQPSLVHAMYEKFFFFSTSGCCGRWHFYKQASSTNIFLTKKMEILGELIPKPATSTSNGKHQLLTHMAQASCVRRGLMLILIFMTHFVQAQFNQAPLPYGLDSYIIFYLFF